MKNVLVVTNHNAGRRKAVKYRKTLQKFLLKNTESFRFISLEEFAETDIEQFDTVIVMGGDGTVSSVARRVVGTDKTLGIIPCGTANLFAEKLKIPLKVKKAIELFNKNRVSLVDAVKINDTLSFLRLGTGFDSDVICKTPQSLKNRFGYFSYLVAGVLFALRLKCRKYEFVENGIEREVEASCVVVANASNMYRRFFSVGKETKIDDGLFDVFVLKTENPFVLFWVILEIFANCHKNSDYAEFFKTKNLLIKNKWLNTHIDGEEYKIQGDISFEIVPEKLKVFS